MLDCVRFQFMVCPQTYIAYDEQDKYMISTTFPLTVR